MGEDNAAFEIPATHLHYPLLPTPPDSAGPSAQQYFLLSAPTAPVKSHYRPFSQYQLTTPPHSASLPPEVDRSKTLRQPKSHLHLRHSFSPRRRPVSAMGFITCKKEKEAEKEKEEKKEKEKEKTKEKEKEKQKEKEKKDKGRLSKDKDEDDRDAMSRYFSLGKPSKPLKKKRSMAKLLTLSTTELPSVTRVSPSPVKNNSPYLIEDPIPFPSPDVPNEEEASEDQDEYTYRAALEKGEVSELKYRSKNRWARKGRMKMHPYGKDAVYMQSYDDVPLDNDRHFDILLRRINPNGSPSFYDYAGNGERPPTSVLDLACGQGHWVLQAATQWPNAQVVGFDLVDVAIPQVHERDNITIVRGNFLHYALPFPTQSFDFVRIANASLAIPYKKWEFVIHEVQRVLTRGGRLEVIDDQMLFPYANPKMTQPRHRKRRSGSAALLQDTSGDVALSRSPTSNAGEDIVSGKSGFDDTGDGHQAEMDISRHETAETVDADDSASLAHRERHDEKSEEADGAVQSDPSERPEESLHVVRAHRRMSSSPGPLPPLGPRPNARPLSMSGVTWKKHFGITDDGVVVMEMLSSSSESEDAEDEDEADTSDSEDDVYFDVAEVQPRQSFHELDHHVVGPRPNARPMSMSGNRWKKRLTVSLWSDDERNVVEKIIRSQDNSPIEIIEDAVASFRMSSISDSSFDSMSSATSDSTLISSSASSISEVATPPDFSINFVMPEVLPLHIEKHTPPAKTPPMPIRRLPSPPNEPESEGTVDGGSALEVEQTEDDLAKTPTPMADFVEFVTSPEELEATPEVPIVIIDDKFLPPTPMTFGSDAPVLERKGSVPPLTRDDSWQTRATKSQELEHVFTDMLQQKYGIHPTPNEFMASALERVFGEGKSGRVQSLHLMLAPEEFAQYVVESTGESSKKKKKESKVRWSDDMNGDEKDGKKVLGMSLERDKKHTRPRAQTGPSAIGRNSSESSRSSIDLLPEGISAKAATRLGITYSALAAATIASRSSVLVPSSSRPSEDSSEEEDADEHGEDDVVTPVKQNPGLLLWPSTLIPMGPAELEMHACKNVHTVLGCKPALDEWISGYVDEEGKRVVSEAEFEQAIWDYECFRRRRFNWPAEIPETSMETIKDRAEVFNKNIEIPNTPKSAASLKSTTPSTTSSNATIPATSTEPLAGGVYAREDLTHVRTIRVYEAVKSWRQSLGEPSTSP
ncbi:hypothetical protein Moror_4829 [Moniliophthora roreri MCA 2997]|uniref:Methyltransferase domain-containing protein n=1 Tax=Moniliophthora roreri (strain MCA 2997) TaxID=1381753 RepID=V2WZB4_MONRO|nr:hypothetical protein Moror_4829 [Moniliophthora roreri MCA 2997]